MIGNIGNKLKALVSAVWIAGIMLIFIGIYFLAVGAGIPYQDPTVELTIKWEANYLAGTMCTKCGVAFFIIGIVGYVVLRICRRGR